MPKIAKGSAFDLAGYQLKGEYTFTDKLSAAELSAAATAQRERMRQSEDPEKRRIAQGTVPGMGTPKPTPMHMVRPAKRGKK